MNANHVMKLIAPIIVPRTSPDEIYRLGLEAGKLLKVRDRRGKTKAWLKKRDAHLKRCREAGLNIADDALDGTPAK